METTATLDTLLSPEEVIIQLNKAYELMITQFSMGDLSRSFFRGSVNKYSYRIIATGIISTENIGTSTTFRNRIENPTDEDRKLLIEDAYKSLICQIYNYITFIPNYIKRAAERMEEIGKKEYTGLMQTKSGKSQVDNTKEDYQGEKNHYQWVRDDGINLGLSLDEITNTPESSEVKQFKAVLERTVNSNYPLGILGPAFVLQELSARRAEISSTSLALNMKRYSGIPNIENAVSTFEEHAKADVVDIRDLIERILVMTPDLGDFQGDFRSMITSANDVAVIYPTIYNNLPLPRFRDYLRTLSKESQNIVTHKNN